MSSASVVLGVRVGTQKTVCIDTTGELLLTESGGVTWPTLLSFDNKLRLFGENALPYFSNPQTYAAWNHFFLAGMGAEELQASRVFRHRKYAFSTDEQTKGLKVSTSEGEEARYAVSVGGMFVNRLRDRAVKVYRKSTAAEGSTQCNDMHFAMVVPPAEAAGTNTAAVHAGAARRMQEACFIAGINCPSSASTAGEALVHPTNAATAPTVTAHTYNAIDCIVAAYTRRVNALRPAERAALVGKRSVLFQMGHSSTSVVLVQLAAAEAAPTSPTATAAAAANAPVTLVAQLLSWQFDAALGAVDFDEVLYTHLLESAVAKHPSSKAELLGGGIARGSKRDIRLSLACERARKLLSTLPVGHVTVENLTEALGDVNLSVTGKELEEAAAGLLTRLEGIVRGVLQAGATEAGDVSIVEVFGGGSRMPCVHAVLTRVFGADTTLGAKLEDSSIALGAALLCKKELAGAGAGSPSPMEGAEAEEPAVEATTAAAEASVPGLPLSTLLAEHATELAFQATDAQIQQLLDERNVLESFILESRNIPNDRQFGATVDAATRTALSALLEEYENWMYDNGPDSGAMEEVTPLELLKLTEAKNAELKEKVTGMCAAYFEAKAAAKAAKEAELEAGFKAAEAERAANGEDGEEEADHDTRKLKKPDRMRLVVKNKEEGTELFKGGNFRPAAARYQKALTHASKFFDLSPADTAEVNAVKVSLFSNLAMCYIKMANYDQVIRYCGEAIDLDPNNAKAYFRRSSAWEAKKEWDKALSDANKSAELVEKEDKLVTNAIERIKRELGKIKDKEKKMWGKAFS